MEEGQRDRRGHRADIAGVRHGQTLPPDAHLAKGILVLGEMMKFLLGIALGYGIGLVIAPASGEETRRRIAENVDRTGRERAREWGAKLGEATFDKVESKVTGERRGA